MPYFAHTVDGSLEKGQYLVTHLTNVANGAHERAAKALPERRTIAAAAYVAGLLHDIGKYRDGFIAYLKKLVVPQVDRYHKQAGAAWAETLGLGPVVMAILGHHGGMPNEHEIDDLLKGCGLDALRSRKSVNERSTIVRPSQRSGPVFPTISKVSERSEKSSSHA